jgi:hypothetical protein
VPADYQAVKDTEQLRLLSLFHYIYGGLTIAMSSIALVHITIGIMVVTHGLGFTPPAGPAGSTATTATTAPAAATPVAATQVAPMPPAPFTDATFGWLFIIVGSTVLLFGWTCGILTIVSGRSIKRRRWRLFSLVIAGICCLNMPLGTVLGVFTFIVLLRDSVKAQYAAG